MKHLCPVCGYPSMDEPPEDFAICPCCGVEFGLDDFEASHAELRNKWLQDGAPWFSHFTPPPTGWNPYKQVLNAVAHNVRADDVSIHGKTVYVASDLAAPKVNVADADSSTKIFPVAA